MNSKAIYTFLDDNSYLLTLAITGLTIIMLALTLFPADFVGPSRIWSYDKIGHLLLFGSWTYILGLYHHIKREGPTKLWIIFLIGVLFGLLIEVLQHSLPLNRHAEWADFLFDMIGCLLAIGILKITVPK